MDYPQVRQRDPIFDENTQAFLERRGKELLGLLMIAAGVLVALLLGSYSPDDPGWMSATDGPAQNILGHVGAVIASPLSVILGRGAWGLALIPVVWGLRFLLHAGEERALGRLIFAPISIALMSVYASTLVPGAEWTHSFGLGGLFGDTVLGAILGMAPVAAGVGIKGMAVISFVAAGVLLAFACGVTFREMKRFGMFLLLGVVMLYTSLRKLMGKGARGAAIGAAAGASGAFRSARAMQERRREARSDRAMAASAEDDALLYDDDEDFSAPPPLRTARVMRAEPPMERMAAPAAEPRYAAEPEPAPRGGLLSRVPSLLKRQPDPEPELVEAGHYAGDLPEGDGDDARISAKIASALKARARGVQPLTAGPANTEQMIQRAAARHRGPQPLRAEPPVMRGAAPAPAPQAAAPLGAPLGAAVPPAPMPEAMSDYGSDYGYDDTGWQDAAPEADDYGYEAGYDDRYDQPEAQPAPSRAPLQRHVIPTAPEAKKVVQHAPRKPVQPSARAVAEAQPSLAFEEKAQAYDLPPLSLLTSPVSVERHHLSDEALEENARMLETVLDDYGVKGEIVSVRPGPVVTMYELEPAPGLKASRVIGLADDIARSMSALSARVSTVPGRSVIGIELPNANREKVVLREILSAKTYGDSNMSLPLALGKDIGGDPIVANLAKMPHLLIAGTTGSGKSVAINTMILSLLYRLTPDECRLIMIDPKMLELSVYDGIPHLLSPVVTDPKKAVVALKWVVAEMEERYRKMSKMGVRNIEGFNGRVQDAINKGEMFNRVVQTGFDEETGEPIFESEEFAPEKLPYIVVIVDEMADLMMVAGKEIEACIQRLAQMARASGIHLIMATQRPSVDVITGTIKANFPTRISFQVTSKIDSRTILGEQGAEQLLGMGDMLFMAGGGRVSRVHGPFVSDEEVEEIVNHLKSFGPPDYVGGVVEGPDDEKAEDIDAVLGLSTGGNTSGEDALYDQAVAIVIKDRKCSTSYIQRKLGIGYNKAARLVEQMEEEGLVSPANHVGKREILVPEQQ